MKKWDTLEPPPDYNAIIKQMDEILSADPDGISQKAKEIFREHAEASGVSKECRKWCEAIEALPSTEKFLLLNIIELEVSLDIGSGLHIVPSFFRGRRRDLACIGV